MLAYNLRRMISLFGVKDLIKAIQGIAVSKICVVLMRFERIKSGIFLNPLITKVETAIVIDAPSAR